MVVNWKHRPNFGWLLWYRTSEGTRPPFRCAQWWLFIVGLGGTGCASAEVVLELNHGGEQLGGIVDDLDHLEGFIGDPQDR